VGLGAPLRDRPRSAVSGIQSRAAIYPR
jgi:hypothetical protein